MFSVTRRSIGVWAARLAFSALVAFPCWWMYQVLGYSRLWFVGVGIAAIVSTFPDELLGQYNPPLSAKTARLLLSTVIIIPFVFTLSLVQSHPVTAAFYALTTLLLIGLGFAYQNKTAAANIGLAMAGVIFALIMANIAAGIVLKILDQPRTQQAPPTPQPEVVEATEVPTQAPTDPPSEAVPTEIPPTIAPTATLDPDNTPEPSPTSTSTPEPPIAGFGYLDYIEDNGEAEWTHLTGYGPRINSKAHAYMYDANGQIVYDTIVEWNSEGMRGPEIPYEKPANTYRILIIGDSFVEAIQQDYENTFPALLQAELSKHDTPDRQYQVVAMGRTGWGTMHELAYYQNEGYRFNANLVILSFYINDVADTFPRVFYPNINNTNYDFFFSEDGMVHIVNTNNEPLPINSARALYNALPSVLQNTNLARLFVRAGDPPIPVVTPGGVLTRVHPQFYIYVDEPEIEGYPEAWKRVEQAMTQFAKDTDTHGSDFAILSISVGEDMVNNVSHWFPDLTEGYVWNSDRPDQILSQILDSTDASLILTRPRFEEYGDEVGGELYRQIFLPEDGHFNQKGHELTAEVLYQWLVDQGIVQ